MSLRQTRRSISVRGATYDALLADCGKRGVSVSEHVEQLIAADRAARGVVASAPAPRAAPRVRRNNRGAAPPAEYNPIALLPAHQQAAKVQARSMGIQPGRDVPGVREARKSVPLAKDEVRW